MYIKAIFPNIETSQSVLIRIRQNISMEQNRMEMFVDFGSSIWLPKDKHIRSDKNLLNGAFLIKGAKSAKLC